MNKMTFVRNYLLALLVFNLAACSTMQSVDVENAMRHAPPAAIDIGSLVEVQILDDQRLKFRVTGVSSVGLDGKYGVVAFEDMAWLKVEVPSKNDGKATAYILGALGFIAMIALIGSADTVRICSHSPCDEL